MWLQTKKCKTWNEYPRGLWFSRQCNMYLVRFFRFCYYTEVLRFSINLKTSKSMILFLVTWTQQHLPILQFVLSQSKAFDCFNLQGDTNESFCLTHYKLHPMQRLALRPVLCPSLKRRVSCPIETYDGRIVHILLRLPCLAFRYSASWKYKIAPCIRPRASLRRLQLGSQGTEMQIKKTRRQWEMLHSSATCCCLSLALR